MPNRSLILAGAVAVLAGCLPGPGGNLKMGPGTLKTQIEFDHNCPPDHVRLIRNFRPVWMVDLDVCGTVRRYKIFVSSSNDAEGTSWLDVTALYPADALSAPLPPMDDKRPVAPPPAVP